MAFSFLKKTSKNPYKLRLSGESSKKLIKVGSGSSLEPFPRQMELQFGISGSFYICFGLFWGVSKGTHILPKIVQELPN